MVFFTCNACGESLKKNQVEKHCATKCKRCECLSCVDCGKDFWGDDYQTHIKCVSEEEKYSGKGWQPKANANKGEKKQEAWMQLVEEAIASSSTTKQLREVLQALTQYDNIPRKKAKFENFIKNSMRIRNNKLVAEVWEILEKKKTETAVAPVSGGKGIPVEETNSKTADVTDKQEESSSGKNSEGPDLKALSKEERKVERKRVKAMRETGEDEKTNGTVVSSESKQDTKKNKKKRSKADAGVATKEVDESEDEENAPKKKKKKKGGVIETLKMNKTLDLEEEVATSEKFDWGETVISVLESKGELPLKKLKKKVLAEYVARVSDHKTEGQLSIKLDKHLKKNPRISLLKDKVALKPLGR